MNLGKLKKIKLNTVWNLEPLMTKFAFGELAGDFSQWKDLYMNGDESAIMRAVRFPQEIELTAFHERVTMHWSCFQTEAWLKQGKDYHDIIEAWKSSPVDTVPIGEGQKLWRKEIFGLDFVAKSYEEVSDA